MSKIGMRKHLINRGSRNYPSSYDKGFLDYWDAHDIHTEFNIKRKPHSDWGGRKPKWRAERKQQRKFRELIRCGSQMEVIQN
jgi:hypothetical protein